jgi:hypothetical protein
MAEATFEQLQGVRGSPAVENQTGAGAKSSAEELPTRINLGLSPRAAARLIWLRQKTDASTNAEVLRNALRLYDALIEEAEKGNELLIRHPNGEIGTYRLFW